MPLTHPENTSRRGPIGVFDSGFGGLTILDEISRRLPDYDYVYLGDNARAPYGPRGFDTVYRFTLQAVEHLFALGCPLVILACNTASAKALRTIQQNDLPAMADPSRRVLGVIRPTAEYVAGHSASGHIGLVATPGTVASRSYELELAKLAPSFSVTSLACPMWVPLVENGEADTPGAEYFVRRDTGRLLDADPLIDTLILGCTHYPLLYDKIRAAVPPSVNILHQGTIVADSLADYLRRHPEMESRLSRGARTSYFTTDDAARFAATASHFLGRDIACFHASLGHPDNL